MIAATQRLLLGACLFAGRSSAFHVPVASSLPGRARLPLADAGQGRAARSNSASLRRRVHSTGVVMAAAATSGVMQETIEARLTEALSPVHLEVINESDKHAGPAKESHFKVVVVSEEFEGKPLLARHRMVNALFESEMKGVIHALSIQGKTPSQWEAEGHKVAPSPPCMGGSKADPSMGGETPTALGAAQQQRGRAPGRRRRGSLEARFLSRRRRQRRSSNLAPACLYAGLFAVAALLSCPAATSAAGSAAKAGARAAGSTNLVAHVDKAFWVFAENLGRLLSLEGGRPFDQCTVMFYTAWVTNCIGPVPAAGAIQQPLGRAMLATASSHACYAACSFLAAAFALSTFPPLFMTPTRGFGRDLGSPEAGPKPAPKPIGARNNRQRSGRPSLKLPSPLLPPKRRGPPASAPTGPPVTRIQVRRSARSVPKVWLMAATALGGPAMGAVGAAVSWKAGLVAIPAALSSLSRGSAFSVLVAGTLCYGGAGTAFVARWAVFQGVVGGLFAAMLTPSALLVVYMCNYYGRMVTDRRRRGPGPPLGGMKGKGGRGAAGLGAKREGTDADGKRPEKPKEGGSADNEDKKIGKDK